MGRITRKAPDREETPKPKRKRRKRDLDRIHSKILKAKTKLDHVEKNGNKNGRKRQVQAKICSRLLPKTVVGIYRNGAKGKDIQKAETSENMFNKARLKADALKLLNGDTPESTCMVEIPTNDESTKQSCFVKNSLEWTPCTLKQSPVLSKREGRNQKLCPIKKKVEESFFKNLDLNKVKKYNVNDESKYAVQKEDMCKRRLFQNDKEQLEDITIQSRIFDDIDPAKENRVREKKAQQTSSENSKAMSPLQHYAKLCKVISAENFEGDFLQNYQSDPLTTTIKKLRYAYADSFRQHLLRKKKQELINTESPFTLEYQACTHSDISRLSPIEFEVANCSENRAIATYLEEDISQKKDKYHLIQNAKFKKGGDAMHYNSTSHLRDTSVAYDASNSIVEDRKNNNNQRVKQSSGIHQSPKPVNIYFINEKDSTQLDSQKNRSYVNHASKNKQHNKNIYIDIPDYENLLRYIDNTKCLISPVFPNDSTLPTEKHLSKDYLREKLLTAISDNSVPNNAPQKYKDRTINECNIKNVKRIPPILRRCSNVTTDKNNDSTQINDGYAKNLYRKFETNLFNKNPSNDIAKKFYETKSPNIFKDILTHNNTCNNTNGIIDTPFDRTKMLEPQIGSMKIKDSQESQIETFDMNICPNKLNEGNRFCRFDNSLHQRTFEISCNTNASIEKLPQQEHVMSNMKKHIFRSNNHHPINYLQRTSSNSNVQKAERFSEQIKLHMCESNNSKQELFGKNTCDQNQNILFNDRAMSTANLPQNIQTDKRSRVPICRKMVSKTDVESKNQINQNMCRCNERYIYCNSANPPKCNASQMHHLHEETAQTMMQSEILYDTKSYDNSTDNCINMSNAIRNVPLSLEQQKHHLYRYSKMINDQQRAVLLQNVTQPIKYLAVKNGPDIQRIPVYINDGTVRVAEHTPLKVIALMDSNIQTKAFPQEVAAQIIPLQTNNPQFNDFGTHTKNNQSFIKHLDPVNAIVFNADPQANTWYASNL